MLCRVAFALLLCGFVHGGVITETNWNSSPIVGFFVKLIQGQSVGALECKSDRCCGDGLKCDLLLHLCVPMNTPVFRDTEKSCSSDNDCSGLHTCILGSCRFCGPRVCHTNMDCCSGGVNNVSYECVDTKFLEQWTLAKELGHISPQMFENMKPHKLDNNQEIDSEELEVLGSGAWGDWVMHGKRCWERCAKDADCSLAPIPENLWKDNWGCCNGFCTRRKSCISMPENLRGIENFQTRGAKTMF